MYKGDQLHESEQEEDDEVVHHKPGDRLRLLLVTGAIAGCVVLTVTSPRLLMGLLVKQGADVTVITIEILCYGYFL